MYIAEEVIEAKPLKDYKVKVKFKNGDVGIFDVFPYLEIGPAYQKLKELTYFNGVKVLYGVISWYDEVDFSPQIVFEEAKRI